jgi:hypothetical protein
VVLRGPSPEESVVFGDGRSMLSTKTH